MSTMSVTNSTNLPIHIATEWDGIVQEFKNYLEPGQSYELPAASFFGWQDFVAVIGIKDTEINHKDDWLRALSFGALIAGVLTTVSGIALTVVTFGAAAPVVVAGIEMSAAAITTAGVAGAIAGGVATTAGATATIVSDLRLKPAMVQGLWGPDGYNINIQGGNITGGYDKNTNKFHATEISPIIIEWKNKVSGTHGTVNATR